MRVARRIFLAHLALSYRLGRKVTLGEFGEMIAKEMGPAASGRSRTRSSD